MDRIRQYFTSEFITGWGKYERVIFPCILLTILIISLVLKDNPVAIISAVFGITYTILAGKGKVSCYFFGLAGTLCYSYLSYKNGLFGNLALYLCYYFPMQVLGIFKWRQHLKKNSSEIIKTRLSNKERVIYLTCAILFTILFALVLVQMHDKNPVLDSITSIFSVLGMLFTVKRCIEQWHVWIIVNGISVVMWLQAYFIGSNCFATVLMWLVYFIVAFYFLHTWKKETSEL